MIYWVAQMSIQILPYVTENPKGFWPTQYLKVKSIRFDGGNRRWKEEGEREKTRLRINQEDF